MNSPQIQVPSSSSSDPLRPHAQTGSLPRLIRFSAIVLALAGLAAFATIIYSASGPRESSSSVPLITADTSSFRERPTEPGGMTVPNQDSTVYSSLSGDSSQSGIERLLPPPEAPMDAPTPVVGEANPPIPGMMPEPTRPDGRPALTAEEIRLIHQQRKQALEETGDATVSAINQLASAASEPAGGYGQPSLIATPAPQQVAEIAPAEEPMITPVKPEPEENIAAAAAEVQKVAPAAGAATPPPGANRFVQLGAMSSKAAAEKGFAKLQKNHPDQLGGLSSSIKKVTSGSKGTLWRMRAGPVTAEQAKDICAALKARKTDCIVTK